MKDDSRREKVRFVMSIKKLQETKERLEDEVAQLQGALWLSKHQTENVMLNSLTGKGMLSEAEIVRGAVKDIPRSGVYFLIRDERVVYIGQSKRVLSRIMSHEMSVTKGFDAWSFIPVPEDQLDIVESIYLHAMKPPDNGKGPRGWGISAPMSIEKIAELAARGREPDERSEAS